MMSSFAFLLFTAEAVSQPPSQADRFKAQQARTWVNSPFDRLGGFGQAVVARNIVYPPGVVPCTSGSDCPAGDVCPTRCAVKACTERDLVYRRPEGGPGTCNKAGGKDTPCWVDADCASYCIDATKCASPPPTPAPVAAPTQPPTGWEDGRLCGLGTTCDNCENSATYWTKKAMTACGTAPAVWGDGMLCGLGTTCNNCENAATYWTTKLMTACGDQPDLWSDGTLCGIGTTCSNCKNGHSYWVSKLMTACGHDSCWEKGTFCFAGTSCNECCNGYSWSTCD